MNDKRLKAIYLAMLNIYMCRNSCPALDPYLPLTAGYLLLGCWTLCISICSCLLSCCHGPVLVQSLLLFTVPPSCPRPSPTTNHHPPIPPLPNGSVLPQAFPHTLSTSLSILLVFSRPLLPQQLGSLRICRALVVWARKQADDAQQDRLGGLDGTPPLGGAFVAVLVLLGRVQDGDAQEARVRVDVGVEGDGVLKGERGGQERVFGGEAEAAAEVGACEEEAEAVELAAGECEGGGRRWGSVVVGGGGDHRRRTVGRDGTGWEEGEMYRHSILCRR